MEGFREEFKKVMEFLKKEYPYGRQTFFTPNIAGDTMFTVYEEDGIRILNCPYWDYIEIFGLTDDEIKELEFHTNYCNMPSGEW